MPVSAAHLAVVAKSSLEYYLRNIPVDQITIARPWVRKLRAMKKSFPGGKQNIVEQLRKSYDGNFSWYFGEQPFRFNRRDTLQQAFFPWRSCRDGFTMTDDDFIENGLKISQSSKVTMSRAEKIQLTNIFQENSTALMESFSEAFDQSLTRMSSGAESLGGLASFVTSTPASGTVGQIDASLSANSYWRNGYTAGLTTSNLVDQMERGWKKCVRNGGMPDYIMVGEAFEHAFRAATKDEVSRYTVLSTDGQQPKMDPSVGSAMAGGVMTGLKFKGIELVWNPVFEELDIIESTSTGQKWTSRCFMLNCRHIKLRPVEGYDEVSYTPPTVYDREAHFFAKRFKGALTTNRRNAHWLGQLAADQ